MTEVPRLGCPVCGSSSSSHAVDAVSGRDRDATDGFGAALDSRRRRALLLGTATAAAGAVGVASVSRPVTDGGTESAAAADAPDRTTDPTLIAHRGFAGENPENTRAAARAAAREEGPGRRADLVEVDVVPTADGDVVAFHDDELSGRDDGLGLTDETGVVWETDTETVTSAEVLRSGETVPRLGALLESIPADVGVNVELKNPGSTSLRFAEKLDGDALEAQRSVWRPFVERVVEILDGHDHEVLFSSFYEAALAVAAERSTASLAPILWESVADGVAIADAYDADALHPPAAMVRGTPFFDDARFGGTDLVRTARDRGWAVNAWTVDSWYRADRLLDAGVDGLIADYSALVRE
ncbi:glycerophosphoryl diester phosphodiesterase [Halorubrum trapanicum]|uniref:Glycerophosphoryl diester phosphodiesterase n=1 Tax=Halorubrum trapanicum TaxID=29284 RepID=A0A8J7UL48_9EURY|nr:glycerophosphodiester phosphodiesterase [Halorubrum trapanicum]MBP1901895.1 glycerophosphoryl diester phosphodiesterase [Halorubrum trapanicum]